MGDAGTVLLSALATRAPYTYLVYKTGSTYYALNSATGVITNNTTFSTLLNTTIAACSDGDCIAIAPGTYTRTAQIDILKNNFTLLGLGRVTLVSSGHICGIKCGDGTTTYTGIRVENIRIDMGGWATAANDLHGIWMQKVNDFIVTHCDVGNCEKGHPFRSAAIVAWDCIRGEISFNEVENFSNGIVVGSTTLGTTSEGIRIIGNHAHDIDPYDCITVYRSAGKCTVTGNHCHDGFYSGILIEGGVGIESANTTVSGNVCHDTQYGIFIFGAQKVSVNGNTCYNNTNFGINVRAAGMGELSINGNVVNNSTNAGIHVGDSTTRGTVTGNTVTGCLHGMHIETTSHYWNIAGNSFHFNRRHGLLINGSSNESVVGNIISENSQETHNTYADIRLENTATINSFVGNKFPISSATTNKPKNNIEEAASTETGNMYYNNFFSPLVSGAKMIILGAGSKAIGNENWRTDNSGTSIQSGNASTIAFTISHLLAATPTWAIVEPTSADARGTPIITLGSSTITLTYPSAPPTGTNNLSWIWKAGVYS